MAKIMDALEKGLPEPEKVEEAPVAADAIPQEAEPIADKQPAAEELRAPADPQAADADIRAILINQNRALEEQLLRRIDMIAASNGANLRWLSVARTHVEEGFMALNRAIANPPRVQLPGDNTGQ